jgi:hypothetical protein
MTPYIYDMVGSATKNLNSGKAYAISNIASLPTTFTDDFTALSLADGVAQYTPAKELPNAAKFGIQIFVPAVGAGFSKVTTQLQCSNTGGSAAGVWTDVGTATETPTAAGSAFLTLPTDSIAARHAKFYRLKVTTTGGTATYYAIAYGFNES